MYNGLSPAATKVSVILLSILFTSPALIFNISTGISESIPVLDNVKLWAVLSRACVRRCKE